MDPAPEDFDRLRKLLALKRHEAPPPGYFDRFGDGVRARIAAEQAVPRRPWWNLQIAAFDAKPILVGAYAVALAGLVMIGVNMFQNTGQSPVNEMNTEASQPGAQVAPAVASTTNLPPGFLVNPGTGQPPASAVPAGFTPERR